MDEVEIEKQRSLELEIEARPASLDPVFESRLQTMNRNMREAMEQEVERKALVAKAAMGSGVAISTGLAAWVLKGGSLLANVMASMPAWSAFDPLPVLAGKRKRKLWGKDSDQAEQDTAEVKEIFDDPENAQEPDPPKADKKAKRK
ncbi:MAG: hypothetical protein V3W06_05265 [Acidimicrobiia bacterium]